MCSIVGFSTASYPAEHIRGLFGRSESRGPDQSRFENVGEGFWLGFNRLEIMDLSESGMQPFHLDGDSLVCNGEVYCFRPLREPLMKSYEFKGQSDCEVLLPLWKEKAC